MNTYPSVNYSYEKIQLLNSTNFRDKKVYFSSCKYTQCVRRENLAVKLWGFDLLFMKY